MKNRILALLTALMLMSCLTIPAFASGESGDVISPEHDNTEVDPNPSSPQTGALLGVGGAAVLMAVSGGVAVFSGKKARDCR